MSCFIIHKVSAYVIKIDSKWCIRNSLIKKREIAHDYMVFFPASMHLQRFHLFHITKSSFIKQMFSSRSGKTNCHRNITDLLAAKFTTVNINIWHQNIKHTATVTIQMGVYSFPYLNVKNVFFIYLFSFSFFRHTHASRARVLRLRNVHKPTKNSYNKKKTATNSTGFFPPPSGSQK